MRKFLMGLLLAATAAAPALADKGGGGHGGGPKGGGGGWHQQGGGGGPKGGGWNRGGGGPQRAAQAQPRFDANRGGGWQHQQRAARQQRFDRHPGPQQVRFDNRGKGKQWQRQARFDHGPEVRARQIASVRGPDKHRGWQQARFDRAPVGFARFDGKQARKAWKHEVKAERRFQRAFARQDWVPPGHRWARQPVVRYQRSAWYQPPVNYAPRFVGYAPLAVAPAYYASQNWYPSYGWNDGGWGGENGQYDGWWSNGYAPLNDGYDRGSYDDYGYAPYDDYGYAPASYAYDNGYAPYGDDGGFGLLGGSDSMLATLLPVLLQSVMGGDATLGSLTGYDNSLDVLPLQQASYAPYGGDSYSSLLLPSVLGNSFF